MGSKIRRSAKNKACQLRLDGCAGGADNETVILAHLNSGGMGKKAPDFHGAFCCASCHDIVDGRKQAGYERDSLRNIFNYAILKSQLIMFNEGLIKCE